MRSGNENIRAIGRDAMHFSHGAHGVIEVLDDVGHVDTRKRVVRERPGVNIQVPDVVGGGIGRNVDSDGVRFDFARAAADIQDHSLTK